MNEEKEVYFDQYCKSCKHHGLEESKDPCNDCLAEPSNTNSHKPMIKSDISERRIQCLKNMMNICKNTGKL